jgi:demethylmenaquinone methyltransferase/2-methoxy-6-polyprenyl-1,4-benzoquinol methylase
VLEFSMPGGLLGRLYRSYFTAILPRVGSLVSGDASAYSYLPASVQKFPTPAAFAALMERAGFADVRIQPLTFGIACLHRGEKLRADPIHSGERAGGYGGCGEHPLYQKPG